MKKKKNSEPYVMITSNMIKQMQKAGVKNFSTIVLYALIVSLSEKKQYCTASNAWFAEFMGMTKRNIQRLLNDLKGTGAVKIYESRDGKYTYDRYIYPQCHTLMTNMEHEPELSCDPCPEWKDMDKNGLTHDNYEIEDDSYGDNYVQNSDNSPDLKNENVTLVIKSNKSINSNNIVGVADAPESYADAPLNGSAYAPPDSASLRNAKLTEEEIQELDFGGKMSNDLILDYTREYFDDLIHQGISIPEAYNQIIAELTDSGGFYGCKMEPLRKYMNHLVAIQSGD